MARPRITEPTDKHLKILRTIVRWERELAPLSMSDIARELGYSAASGISDTLAVMERMRLIETVLRGHGKIVLATEAGRRAVGIQGIPLLGTIPAGSLSEVIGAATTFIELTELVPHKQGDFLLLVEGESMIGEGILSGDAVLMRPNIEPHQGDIVAVLVGDERKATLKKIYFDAAKKEVRLCAANPEFQDQVVRNEDIRIAGVFQTLVRQRGGISTDTP